MIHFIRRSVNNVKTANSQRKVRRQMMRFGFNIRKSSNGTVRILTPKTVWTVEDLPRLSFEERVEKVKWSLLTAGFVWSEEVEKYARAQLL